MADGQNNSDLQLIVYSNGRVDYDFGQNQDPVTEITVSGSTTAVARDLSTGATVDIQGSWEPVLEGVHTITVTGSDTFTFTFTGAASSDTSSPDMTEVPTGNLDFVIGRPDGSQDHGGSGAGTVLQSYTYLGLATRVTILYAVSFAPLEPIGDGVETRTPRRKTYDAVGPSA